MSLRVHQQLWVFLWRYIRRHTVVLGCMLVLLFISTGATIVQPFFYKKVVDIVASGTARTPDAVGQIITFILFGIGFAVIHLTTHESASRLLGWMETRIMRDAYVDAFAYVQRLSTRFHVNAFAGSTSRKIGRGIDSMETILDRTWFNFLPLAVLTVGFAIVLGIYSPLLGAVMVTSIVTYTAIAIPLSMWQSRFHAWTDAKDSEVTAGVVDSITANAVVKAFSSEHREIERHALQVDEWSRRQWKTWKIGTVMTWMQFMLITMIEGSLLLLSAYLWYVGEFTAGDFIVVTAYVGRLWGYMFDIGNNVRTYLRAAAHAEEMIELLGTPQDVADAPDAKAIIVSKGEVVLDRVTFAYEQQPNPVFKDFSCVIRPGEKIALVGHSGGGKSTFVKLLLRLYDLTGGRILIDNQDIAQVTQESLRSSISLVPQDPILFHRSIAENIRYARSSATDAEVERAAKLAHAHEFIERLPRRYDTLVGERGVKLSGGERQRVAIARAILADRPILVLDEATSSLDSISESYIQEALAFLMEGRTTIVIAHRLSTIKRVDRILVVEHGSVIEEGTHDELLKRDGGTYRQLYEMQAGGFLGE
jgi:ATP-binding cassette subfamily B protein